MDKTGSPRSLNEARIALSGMNGNSLVPSKKNPLTVAPPIEPTMFLTGIKDPQLRVLAKEIINLVNDVRSFKLDGEQAKIQIVAFRELIQILTLDWHKEKK